MERYSQRASMDAIESAPKSERLFKASVIAVCGWALIEARLELGGSIDLTWLLAVVASKILIGVIGAAAIANVRFARQAFTFICAASVFAIAPALPLEYARCVAIGLFSMVECLAKAACVASFAIASWTGAKGSGSPIAGSRTAVDQK
ncbi:hypothetical protein B0G57_1183 [Trinickia symbiotica]|uniref:Uncharacterized protein n=1 Tax=Trinickia symbiotica TaxID=863227 RepID=A0A2N7WX28_9BURK|nr:hypothetical protein [Trinickia symbiotica]PMS33872.1 hypothetical protein C0Z20_23375 [Trinickia symbiotica]PPK42464.1 hypothetical protein B0G57_1183 [Trinickia symbiotica]